MRRRPTRAGRADRLRLEQALTNLVDNALRHGGGPVRAGGASDGLVELHVTDEGPGIPDDFIDHAFERFSRADAARGRGGAGLGLGDRRDDRARARRQRRRRQRPGGGADVWIELPG